MQKRESAILALGVVATFLLVGFVIPDDSRGSDHEAAMGHAPHQVVGDGSASTPVADEGQVQKTCPVREANPINPSVYTVYQGKKVYFCCPPCKAIFEANPEEYLHRLPQFSEHEHASGHAHRRSEEEEEGVSVFWRLDPIVKPFGISTLCLLVLTAGSGRFMRRKPGVLFKLHKRLAYTTVGIGLTHALLVLLTH